MDSTKKIRISRYLASCGIASRRKCEEFVLQRRIKVNNEVVCDLSFPVSTQDRVEMDGRLLKYQEKISLMCNKPVGYLSTVRDDFNRKTILDLIDDIQSTLNQSKSNAEGPAFEEQDAFDEDVPADETADAYGEQAILVGNDEHIGEDELVESEPDLIDNLGIDLTSEFDRDMIDGEDEGPSIGEQVGNRFSEAVDNTLVEKIEAVIERVIQEKMETIIGPRIDAAVQKGFEKLRKDILD